MANEKEDVFDIEDDYAAAANEEYAGEQFAIGETVFPVDKNVDIVDYLAVLINHADSYVGKAIGKYLSTRKPGDAFNEFAGEDQEFGGEDEGENDEKPATWKLIGTQKNEKVPEPDFLWATMIYDDFDSYVTELLKCRVIIYDITDGPSPEQMKEIRIVCDGRSRFPTLRGQLQEAEDNSHISGFAAPGTLCCGIRENGAIYGEEESPLHAFFKSAWHNAPYLPVYGPGKNILPTVYIQDLAAIVQNIMDRTPREQRYILAVDPTLHTQEEIVWAISKSLGSGRIKHVPENDIYTNRELSTFQADQILFDIPITSTFSTSRFNIHWTAEDGMTSIIENIVREYRIARNLIPFKIVIVGPPGSGKSTVARQVSDAYHIHHFDAESIATNTIEFLRDKVKIEEEVVDDPLEEEEETVQRDVEEAKSLLRQVDAEQRDPQYEDLSPELFVKLVRYRLKTNPVKNQGYVLDGLPRSFAEAMAIFGVKSRNAGDAGEGDDDDEFGGEDGVNPLLDPLLTPDHVFIFESPETFIKARLAQIPKELLLARHYEPGVNSLIAQYWDQEENYPDTFTAFLHEQEILYEPMDISKDCSHMMRDTVMKISHMLGKPRNYGLTFEEEEAIRFAQKCEMSEAARRKREEYECIKERLLESRRQNIESWMERLANVKREEFEREEAALIPLRQYLMAHVVPTLTKGLIDITRLRPEDPLDYLAEFLFQNNPGGINPGMAGAADVC